MDKSNDRQETFCREYLIDYNGTQAAIRAGYSKKTAFSQASRMLRNVKVLSRVRALQAEKTAQLSISQDWVVHQLVDVVQKCKDPVPVETWDYEEKATVKTGEYMFDSKGATKALELLGKHLGMYIDKVEAKQSIEVTTKLDSILTALTDDDDEGG
jgi:phage terminase small subunit